MLALDPMGTKAEPLQGSRRVSFDRGEQRNDKVSLKCVKFNQSLDGI